MGYTGILGDSELGDFQLGSSVFFVGGYFTQDVFEVLVNGSPVLRATQLAIELFYKPKPKFVLTQDVWEIIYVRPPELNLSQEAWEVVDNYNPFLFVTQSIIESLHTYTPLLRLSQDVIEAIVVEPSSGRLTHDAWEVLLSRVDPRNCYFTNSLGVTQSIGHSSIINRTVTTNIVVAQHIAGGSIPLTVTSNIAVASIVRQYQPIKHQAITSNITVTQTVASLGGRTYFKTVTDNISVNSAITERTTWIFEAVTSNITVASTVGETIVPGGGGRNINITVTSNIGVAQTIGERDTVVRMTVTSNISVGQTVYGRNNVVRISMQHSIGATQTAGGREDINRESVESDIHVASNIVFRSTSPHYTVTSGITVIDTINYRNTLVYETINHHIVVLPHITFFNPNYTFRDSVYVTPSITVQTGFNFQTVTSNITVTSRARPNFVSQSLTDHIEVEGSGYLISIFVRVNPIRITIRDFITMVDAITGGSSHRSVSVRSDITVGQAIHTNKPHLFVADYININQTIGNNFPRNVQAVMDSIVVTPTVARYSAINHQSVISSIVVASIVGGNGPIIPIALIDRIRVVPTVAFRIVKHFRMSDFIRVYDAIAIRPDNNRQVVSDHMTVGQAIRFSPNRQSLIDSIHVTSRLQSLDQTVVSRITVSPNITLTNNRTVQQFLPITQSVVAHRDVFLQVRNDISVQSAFIANHDYLRVIVQRLYIPETDYLLQLDFNRNPIVVPVVTGTIIMPNIMTLAAQGSSIQLPAAQLGDSVSDLNKLEIKKAMDGTARSYIQRVDRKKLVYTLRIGHLKAAELRAFVVLNISNLLILTNWKGEKWAVKITKNPFELTNEGVWEKDKESVTVELEMEGKQLS